MATTIAKMNMENGEMGDIDFDNNILTIKTVQTGPFKTLMNALKDIIIEGNMIFTKEGIKIMNMDKTQTVVVFLELPAEKFEKYNCVCDKIVICVNLQYWSKLMAPIDNNDTLTIYIKNSDYDSDDGFVSKLSLKYDNPVNRQSTINSLRLAEADTEDVNFFPDIKFSSVITMPSMDFQRIIRGMFAIAQCVEIKTVGNTYSFKAVGRFADVEIHRTEAPDNNGGIVFLQKNPSKVIQGIFSLRTLNYFIKCTPLCPQIDLYFENDMPIVVQYAVANMGILRLCLSPKRDPIEETGTSFH